MRAERVVDIAGASIGGAARWAAELDGFVAARRAPIEVIGRGQRLTPGWLVAREHRCLGARLAVAANNAAFLHSGRYGKVLLRNALHFLYPHEAHLLARMPRGFCAQIRLVRGLLRRADSIVVPTTAMAERVRYHLPSGQHRIVVRPHPVTVTGSRQPADEPFILVPVLPAPYKNLVPQVAALLAATERAARPMAVRITAWPGDLPAEMATHPRVDARGPLPYAELATLWRSATAAFYPSAVEAFGYPLAEARAHGIPVLAADTAQNREIAGPALAGYRLDDPDSLATAVRELPSPEPDPTHFDRDAYFRWLFELPVDAPHTVLERHGVST